MTAPASGPADGDATAASPGAGTAAFHERLANIPAAAAAAAVFTTITGAATVATSREAGEGGAHDGRGRPRAPSQRRHPGASRTES